MSQSEQHKQHRKVVQYLNEAHASEQGLVRVLQAQIAMTPRGSYRGALETHLRETRDHARRVERRLGELGHGSNPLTAAAGLVESVVAQALALGKTPFDLLRGSGGEEKVLKNAKDACASEALEIATYTALETLARALGDARRPSWRRRSSPTSRRCLSASCARSPSSPRPSSAPTSRASGSYDITTTGAGDTVREAGEATKDAARETGAAAKRSARKARKVPGVAQAEGEIKGAVASEGDLAIARYDSLTADEITSRLSELSQIDLAKVDAYERKNQDRTTVLSRISTLRGDEPWPGYDELTAPRCRPCCPTATANAPSRPRATSARTRTAPASSRPPSANTATPDAGHRARDSEGPARAGPSPFKGSPARPRSVAPD